MSYIVYTIETHTCIQLVHLCCYTISWHEVLKFRSSKKPELFAFFKMRCGWLPLHNWTYLVHTI